VQEATPDAIPFPVADTSTPAQRDLLTQVLSNGAQQMLIGAVEAEVTQWIDDRRHLLDAAGHRQVWSATATPHHARL